MTESRTMTAAERRLLELALVDDWRNKDEQEAALRAVLRERVPEGAVDKHRAARMAYLAAHGAYHAAVAEIDLPDFMRDEINEECGKLWREQARTRYVYTGMRVSDEQEAAMQAALQAPLIGRNVGKPVAQMFIHEMALKCGLPEIRGHYGYDFQRHEFIHEPGATDKKPDAWK